jgi:hypothetical protein
MLEALCRQQMPLARFVALRVLPWPVQLGYCSCNKTNAVFLPEAQTSLQKGRNEDVTLVKYVIRSGVYLVLVLKIIQYSFFDQVFHCADAGGARCLKCMFKFILCKLSTAS